MSLATYDPKQNPYYKSVIEQFEEIVQRPLSEEERKELNKKPEKGSKSESKLDEKKGGKPLEKELEQSKETKKPEKTLEHNKSEMDQLLQPEENADFDSINPTVKAKTKKRPNKSQKSKSKHLAYLSGPNPAET